MTAIATAIFIAGVSGTSVASEIVKHHHGELTLAPRDDGRGTRATVLVATAARDNDDRDA